MSSNTNIHISVISPVYRAEKIVDELVKEIVLYVSLITQNFEIILVEDGGPDDSWEKILKNCHHDKRVKGIKLSRNFGQHYAISAGIDNAIGEWIIVMDCDLQDKPSEIPKMYYKAQEGYDIVFGRRVTRQDGLIKRSTSYLFYTIFSYLTGIPQDESIANFGVYSRKAIDAVRKMKEPFRAFTTMVRWVGFKKTAVDIEHGNRFEGKTSYTWSKLINLAIDIILVYSEKPLRLVIKVGFIISLTSMCIALYYLYAYYTKTITVSGFASLIVSIWFLSGLIIFILGVVGLYVGKAFEGVKQRPVYFIDEKVN